MMHETIEMRMEDTVCRLRFARPEARNAINDRTVEEFHDVLDRCEENVTIIVLEGSPEYFSFGGDFDEMRRQEALKLEPRGPEPLYDLWLRFTTGPWITVAAVRGQANAGGVGFVAASDIVLAEETAQFSLSELLFGLPPACVMPFLIRRVGFRAANYMALMTRPFSARQAAEWGLADAVELDMATLLRKHLIGLKRLSKSGIRRYKRYVSAMSEQLRSARPIAVEANRAAFADVENRAAIFRFVETGEFPWEAR